MTEKPIERARRRLKHAEASLRPLTAETAELYGMVLEPVASIPSFAVIIRATTLRGAAQDEALAELKRRGLWLSEDQRRQAGLPPWRDRGPWTNGLDNYAE